ncbi:response regulator transcription factor [Paenibacillus hexagrammi]|uniref:Response regulator transcription factor n=1 Tax=Paenibacillus hexagrammi TaxID=2908839 RepID=A0ABY3SRA5_9BACL|nr:response regulator transcription factor [Paenibacillus sp. YPD9-1]UJF35650.1 response regulator transcription factor [Paenibacillus sp. YPD9-1]
MHILLVEDDRKLGELIQYKLNKQLNQVEWALDAENAMEFMERSTFDMYILDWMMPHKTGIELCKEIRMKKDRTPILMLTARDSITDRVQGLNAGADDYLVKPFAFEELIARLHALYRRKETNWEADTKIFGDILVVDYGTYEVKRNGVAVPLSRREFQLLSFMSQHPKQILSREQLIDHVWGLDAEITLNTVDATIKLLRKKLDDPFSDKIIHNVRGLGYRLVVEGEINVQSDKKAADDIFRQYS